MLNNDLQVMESMWNPLNKQIVGNPFQKLVIFEYEGKSEDQIEGLLVDALAVRGEAALVQIEQPFDVIHKILLEREELLLIRSQCAHPRYFSTHEVRNAHELVLVEFLVVLSLDGGVDVVVVAAADGGFEQTSSAGQNPIRKNFHRVGGFC